MSKQQVLGTVSFGQRVAEDEIEDLTKYFVETDLWRRLFSGHVDVVYGPKGSGKSALYALLVSRRDELFDRMILLAPAENPRGAPAFKDLVADPPTSEVEFTGLWKLYIACIISDVLVEYGIGGKAADQLRVALEREGLAQRPRNLRSILKGVVDYVRQAIRPAAVEGGVEIDAMTGLPKGFRGKIIFREPSGPLMESGFISVDQLLVAAEEALAESKYAVWILLDRLDVAFAENADLEQNALRALFHVYLDLRGLEHLRLKIFLRSDIWSRITRGGFREASHITRHMTISWNRETLLNLVVRRAIQNRTIQDCYRIVPEDVLASTASQVTFFDRMFPKQVDVGKNKPETFDWMLTRTRDGTGQTAPRELIHLLNSLREVQIRRYEVGEAESEGEELFSRGAFKEALIPISRVRVEQTLFAEYPWLRESLEALRGQKTMHTPKSLAKIWHIPLDKAMATAQQLVELGVFEQRGSKEEPEFWVPFLYRDALDLVQGSADE